MILMFIFSRNNRYHSRLNAILNVHISFENQRWILPQRIRRNVNNEASEKKKKKTLQKHVRLTYYFGKFNDGLARMVPIKIQKHLRIITLFSCTSIA